jgi:hypothetical protein
MATITVQLQNNSMMAVVCDPGLRAEISEYFSFFVPGHKFMPAFKSRKWDGKIRLFNSMTCELHVGLYAKLCKFAADRHYHIKLAHSQYGLPNAKNKVDHQKLVSSQATWGMPFAPRDYQYDAITHGIERKRCILLSPTGSGKSFIIYNIMRWYQETHDKSVLVIVPSTSLV